MLPAQQGAVEIPVNGVSNCAAACNDAAGCTTFATFPGGTECDLFDGDFLGFVAATPAGQFTQAFLGTCASYGLFIHYECAYR